MERKGMERKRNTWNAVEHRKINGTRNENGTLWNGSYGTEMIITERNESLRNVASKRGTVTLLWIIIFNVSRISHKYSKEDLILTYITNIENNKTQFK